MPRQPKTITDERRIPIWFNLNNYSLSKDFNAYEWYIQISFRLYCRALIETIIDNKNSNKNNETNIKIPEEVTHVWNNPIIDFENNPKFMEVIMDGDINELNTNTPVHTLGAHILSRYELQQINENIDRNNNLNEELYFRDGELKDFYFISLNLSLPKKLIKEQVDSLIDRLYKDRTDVNDIGKKNKNKKIRRSANYETWFEYGILPYMDLKLWELVEGKKISLKLMAEKIYHDDATSDSETVRTTTDDIFESLHRTYLWCHFV